MPTAVVTGSNTGLGLATATGLARAGFEVVIAVRSEAKGQQAAKQIRNEVSGANVDVMSLDLASLASVRAFAAEIATKHPVIELLVNNAGVTMKDRSVTSDGFEMTFGVNHLGHFLLTNLLKPQLAAAGGAARVVVVGSDAHKFARGGLDFTDLMFDKRKYGAMRVYGASKLANMLFSRDLARRWANDGITVNSVHPGFVATRLGRDGDGGRLGDVVAQIGKPFARTPEKGALTSLHAALAPELASVTGEYFANSAIKKPAATALDDAAAAKLWEISTTLVGAPPE